jgi:D-alanyl-D-alanine carboxypeptidase
MNLKRAIGGFLLSFVFLIFFVYMIFGIQWIFDNSQNKAIFLGSISDSTLLTTNSVQSVTSNDNYENQQIEEININAQSAISVWTNFSEPDKTLFSKNDQRKLSIASISKLMTALIVVENLDLSQEIKISSEAATQTDEPEFELLKTGEIFYAKDLLYTMLIGSDNAASYALSESIGTNEFIGLMNAKAKELGLSDSSFSNPSGLGLANFSTVQDIVKLTEYLFKNHPSILSITTMIEFDLYTVDRKIFHKIINTNQLLSSSPDLAERIIGGKTGKTRTAGECLFLMTKTLNNQGYLISVILNSDSRFQEMKKIIDWVDTNYQWQ